jgi:hypothetical protein
LCFAHDGNGPTETLQSLCAKIGVVDPIIKALLSRGFTTPAKLFWPLNEGSEETFGAILDEAQVQASIC